MSNKKAPHKTEDVTMTDLLNQSIPLPVYDMSINARIKWQSHSLSNSGSNNSNRVEPRRQLLINNLTTDAISGNILKHFHASLVVEYFESAGIPVCKACANRRSMRAAAILTDCQPNLSTPQILQSCALCDTHGFLVTAKADDVDDNGKKRERTFKHSLVEYAFALAIPDSFSEKLQTFSRSGGTKEQGQMIYKVPARSGVYSVCAAYHAAGVGVDTDRNEIVISAQNERRKRHQAILLAFRDQILHPLGAHTATMWPQLSGLEGAIAIRKSIGRAPTYSPLEDNYLAVLQQLTTDDDCMLFQFDSIVAFKQIADFLIDNSIPAFPPAANQGQQ